ncbi:hypothetical protein Tco_0659343, partial [Tanacetum coccineum]
MLVQNQATEGEDSAIPPELQPTPSTSQPNVSEPQTESLQTKTPPTFSHEFNLKLTLSKYSHLHLHIKENKERLKNIGKLKSVERAITTAARLVAAQDSDNILKTQSTAMSTDPLSQEISSGGSPRC